MDRNRKSFIKKRPSNQFKKKGSGKKGRGFSGAHEYDKPFGDLGRADTVYRILCPSRKIGGVIGRGGSIINALRDETQAKITVGEAIPGSDDRVIMIFSPPTRISKKESDDDEDEKMRPHCAAQDALMRVHSRITEEDFFGGVEDDEDNDTEVNARLLVPNNLVGCILGKGGDIIQKLRSETGANIRVLPKDHVPACAMVSDELVMISGKPERVKRALYDVSTRLHQNPRKDNAISAPVHFPGPGFHHHAPPMPNRPPPGDYMPPGPWMRGFKNPSPASVPFGYLDSPSRHGGDPSGEFSLKILCLEKRIGSVIGKGGVNVKQLEQETGTSVQVEEASPQSEERVIRVSAFETLLNPWSQTIDALLQLQPKTSEFSEKGIVTTRILVPASKIGCIIGEGGSIINEMRWRTKADIRVHPKEDKPINASNDEELVHVSGSFPVAKDALAEIASRLRTRILRNANAGEEPPPEPAVPGYGHSVGFPGRGPSLPGPLETGSYRYNTYKGGAHDLEPSYPVNYPVQPNSSRYQLAGGSVEINYPHNASVEINHPHYAAAPSFGPGGSMTRDATEAPTGTRPRSQDPQAGSSYDVAVDVGAPPAIHPNTVQHTAYPYMVSAAQNIPHPGSYPDPPSSQHGSYQGMVAQPQAPYQSSTPAPYQSSTPAPYQEVSYQDYYTQQSAYQYRQPQQTTYQNTAPVQGSYQY